MGFDFKLPSLGEGIDGGDVIDVLVAPGDQVQEGQTLLELETDKAAIPVPAPSGGRIATVHVKQGDHVAVGQKLVTLDGDASESARPGSAREPAAAAPAPSTETPTEKIRETRTPAAAATSKPHAAQGDTPKPPGDRLAAAGPATRRLARELGVDLEHVEGTGSGGRISEDDVKAHARRLINRPAATPAAAPSAAAPPSALAPPTVPLPDFERWGPVQREPLSATRRAIAQRLSHAWNTIPQVTHFDEADITQLEHYRRKFAAAVEAQGGKLTVTAIAVKAVAVALRAMPQFNASLDQNSGELVLKQYVHIGIAVDTDRGLIVPVLRDVDRKTIRELAIELVSLADRTRQKKVGLEELQGGCFTVTNLGGIGGTAFSPIVNWPELAILGLARSRPDQRMHDGVASARTILPLCLSYDHRVIDGAAAARFVRLLAELLEDPFRMALDL